MQHNEQKQRKGPMRLTPAQIQLMKDHEKKHSERMATDPEYRKLWEKREEDFNRIALLNDTIKTK